MIIPSEEQIYERWDTLPDTLREALTSDDARDSVNTVAQSKNLSEEKANTTRAIVGYVLLGFLHQNDVAEELMSQAEVEEKDAIDMQSIFNKTVFASLQKDLNAVYQPLTAAATKTTGPQVKDIAGNINTGKTQDQANSMSGSTPTTSKNTPALDLSQKGWSKMGTGVPVPPPAPAPIPATSSQTSPSSPSPAAFPRPLTPSSSLSQKQSPLRIPQPPQTPKAAPPPKPMMLQQEPSSTQKAHNLDFHLPAAKEDARMDFGKKNERKITSAVIEFGTSGDPMDFRPKPSHQHAPENMPTSSPHIPIPTPTAPQPSSAKTQEDKRGRTVTEITEDPTAPQPGKITPPPSPAAAAHTPTTPTTPIPQPPSPPKPSTISTTATAPQPPQQPPTQPTQPPQPQNGNKNQGNQDKVVVKNFTQ